MDTRQFHNPVQKDTVTFLELAEETGQTLVEVELAPGGGNPLHRHRTYAEHFEVLEGRLTVQLDGVVHVLEAGDRAVAPIGVPHCFRNAAQTPVRFRVAIKPGHRGFERGLQVLYGLAADGRTPRSLVALAVASEWADMRLAGFGALFEPLFSALAWIGRRRGVDRRLARRYVTLGA